MKRGLRHTLASYVPIWASNRPGLNIGFSWLYCMLLVADAIVEQALEGSYASWPGLGTPDADPHIAATRGLIQGMFETASEFEARLRAWWEIYTAGSAAYPNLAAMVQRLWEYTGCQVKLVSRAGNWVIISTSGVISYVDGVALGWDNLSNPGASGQWSDFWIVIA